MADKYLVHEISEMTGISTSTLRYYDRKGIYSPKDRSDENGYRYYTNEQIWSVEILSICQKWNLSLERVKALMECRTDEDALKVLKQHQKSVKEQIAFLKQIDRDIDWYEGQIQQIAPIDTVTPIIKHIPERVVICHFYKGISYSNEGYAQLKGISIKEQQKLKTIQSKYGFISTMEQLMKGEFQPNAGYINLYEDTYQNVRDENVRVLPEGNYICIATQTTDNRIEGAEVIKKYLEQHPVTTREVIFENRGFRFMDVGYLPCEIQILMEKDE